MKLSEWVDTVVGTAVDVDGTYGAQCMDLANDYVSRVLALPRLSGNAIDVPAQRIKGAAWVANGPHNHPSSGDLVVWGWHPYGHIAVVLYASPMHLMSLDQNWDGIRQATPVWHSYASILGWHHFGA